MNTVTLIGRLTREPDTRDGDTAVTRLRLAVPRQRGDDHADFITVVCFNRQAAAAAEFVHKGRLVAVSGRLNQSEWTTDAGERRERVEVIGERVDFLDAPSTDLPEPESC